MSTKVKLSALTLEQCVRILRDSGAHRASEELIQADISAGAPVNADGTINFHSYAAWLFRGGADYVGD